MGPCRDHLVGAASATVITASLPSRGFLGEKTSFQSEPLSEAAPPILSAAAPSAGFKSSSAADCLTTPRVWQWAQCAEFLAPDPGTDTQPWLVFPLFHPVLAVHFLPHTLCSCSSFPLPGSLSQRKSYCSVPEYESHGLPWRLSGRESTCNVRDAGSVPRSGRSPGGGHGNPLQ